MALDTYCLSCGGYTGFPAKKGAKLADCRCARSEGVFSCLGKLTTNKAACPPDKGLKFVHDGKASILVLTTASPASFRAIQRAYAVPVGRCAS